MSSPGTRSSARGLNVALALARIELERASEKESRIEIARDEGRRMVFDGSVVGGDNYEWREPTIEVATTSESRAAGC